MSIGQTALKPVTRRKRSSCRSRTRWLVSAFAVIGLCGGHPVHAQRADAPNVLLILADDLGIETLTGFGVGDGAAATPVLDDLAARGVMFTEVWAQPLCSATRATILTGRYGFRTGVGRQIVAGPALGELPEPPPKPPASVLELPVGGGMAAVEALRATQAVTWGPSLDEFTLPMALNARTPPGYATAAIGKWHLADIRNGWERHPNLAGFDHFAGLLAGAPESYAAWVKVVNGVFSAEVGYVPTDKVDDAVEWIRQQRQPWFLWLNFNLVHVPIHRPPEHLLGPTAFDLENAGPRQQRLGYFKEMIQALDAEIGRLLRLIDEAVLANTYVVFMGDNGTRGSVVGAPFDAARAKGTLYQGGVHVPLIVAGPDAVPGGVSHALVNSTDIFASIVEMSGRPLDAALPPGKGVDSVSIMPYLVDPNRASLRAWVYADLFPGSEVGRGSAAIRDRRFKLIQGVDGEEFYDLGTDPHERRELLANGDLEGVAVAHYRALKERLSALHATDD